MFCRRTGSGSAAFFMYRVHGFHEPSRSLLQTLLVSLDHLLDHLAADGAGFTGGQVTVVAVLQNTGNTRES